ncbi:hypothetical protein JZ751_007089 [Albula glossodonta]|uniref:Hyaluronan-mediated motility receptor C-terminal domain-containing protein n=1 Tax=Albula glossodonta TaxID=121402 RepID=A0A8T2PAW1_9TELE|nr:hypothetical protein JZ751_007089 [Albula glossodonta]
MSFPRAPLKRFNENVGCAPPPGTYEVKNGEVKGAASFHKSERFKTLKALAGQPCPAKDVSSPMRRTLSADGLTEISSGKKDRAVSSVETKQQKLLEREIRSLVQQRAEQDRRLQVLEEELRKLEAKLLAAVREKTGLSASVASLERQLGDLKKANEFLKTKFSTDTTKKRINSLSLELIEAKNKLDSKDKELSYLHINTEGQVKVLEADVEALRATLEALRERNSDLENLHQETKVQNEELETEMDKLHAVIQELREEIKVLKSYLDTANDEIQDLRLKLREKEKAALSVSLAQVGELEKRLEQNSKELQDSQKSLAEKEKEKELQQCAQEQQDSQNALVEKEQELGRCKQELQDCHTALAEKEQELERHAQKLQDSQCALGETEKQLQQSSQELQDSNSTLGQKEQEIGRLREVLRRTEEELDQRVALLGERCLILEEERGRTQEEGLKRVQELQVEISSLEEKRRSEAQAKKQLEDSHTALTEQLEAEKAQSGSLASLLERLQGEAEAERRQLEAELEEALDELSVLEAQEQHSEGEMQRLQQETHNLQKELKEVQTDLDRKKTELESCEDRHLVAMGKLQEEHSSSLWMIGDMATELESTKKSFSEEVTRMKVHSLELEEELRKVMKQFEEERQQWSEVQQSQDKTKEECTRMLLDAQTRLAQKEVELRRVSEAHAAEVERLQGRAEQESKGRQELEQSLERERQEWEQQRRDLLEEQATEAGIRDRAEQLEHELLDLRRRMEEERKEMQRQLVEALEKKTPAVDEAAVWRERYEELYAKVKPFQEQLDSFAAERNALLNENGATQEELNRLADAYARLLGHQNQKQKIKHVVNLKEENIKLKQEAVKLRAQVGKLRKDLDQLKSSNAPRRFDPSKAFKLENKENQQSSIALGQGNQKVA